MKDALSLEEVVELTPEEAIALLPEGEYVHTFVNPRGMMFGADHTRAEIEKEIREATSRQLAGEVATRTGHGLVLYPPGARFQGDLLFVATRAET